MRGAGERPDGNATLYKIGPKTDPCPLLARS